MVVKSERGRRRYILFEMASELEREAVIRRVNRISDGEAPYIVQCEKNRMIARCSPDAIERTIEMVLRMDPGSSSIITSGTLKTIRDKYPELKTKQKKR
jgi:hypothetical protein